MFTESQERAYNELLKFVDNNEKEIIVTGSPGYGKSYLIEEFSRTNDVVMTATTNKAAGVINGITIHSLLGLKLSDDYEDGSSKIDYSKARTVRNLIIVIDECSMINSELYKALFDYTVNCKFIYVGDYYQLPPVNDNFSIFKRNIKMLELIEPCRTNKEDILNLCSQLKQAIRNNTRFKDYKTSENIIFLNHNDYLKRLETFEPTNDKILSHTNDQVLSLNREVRRVFGKSELISSGDYIVCKSVVGTYEPTKIEQIKQVKDVLNTNYDGTTRITTFDGGRYDVYLDQISYKKTLKDLSTKCLKSTYTGYKKWKPYFDFKNSVLDIRDIYAGTVYSAQGSTYNNVFIDIQDIYKYSDSSNLMRLMYVAVSRAKEKVYIFKSE